MNKSDIKLITSLLIISFISIIFIKLNSKKSNYASVYYKNDIVLKIDLRINKTYTVDGELGKVKIKVKNGKVRVVDENSKYHLCRNGYISKSYESIICLPNKIVIEIDKDNELDTVIKNGY